MSLAKQWTERECRMQSAFHPTLHRHPGYACEWVAPYGWVPEANCPIHDNPDLAPLQSAVSPAPHEDTQK